MKTRTPKTPSTAKATGETFTAIPTIAEITANFAAKQKKKESGENDCQEILLALVTGFVSAYENQTFGLAEFVTFGAAYDIPYPEMEAFFNKYVDSLQKAGRVRSVPTCYSSELFQFV